MTSNDPTPLLNRSKQFALRTIPLVESLPNKRTCDVIGKQLLRAATPVGANYRAACRGHSRAEFCAKLGIVEEEADECVYWLELVMESVLLKKELFEKLHDEATEILKMVVASICTARPSPRSQR
jgi:four helix bundle protein